MPYRLAFGKMVGTVKPHWLNIRGERVEFHPTRFRSTIIDDTDHVAGYLPAPKEANADYTLMGKASDGTQVVVAECHHEDSTHAESTPAPEQVDLASSLFGMNVQTAPETEPEADLTQNVLFTYKSGKVKHELRAGSTIVKVGRTYYTQLGRKITAIYTDDTCKRTVPERFYTRLFNVSEDPTLFA